MKCSVCGNTIGLWGRLTAYSSTVCRECREEAKRHMEGLLRSVGGAQYFKLQYAKDWVTEFEETARKYQMLESKVRSLRFSFLNNLFKLVEAEDEMPEDDLSFLASLGKTYVVGQSPTPELLDSIFRVGMREAIQSWERGQIPHKDCNGLVLQKGEACHWEEAAGLRVQKKTREYVGGYSSVSFRVPLVRGARFRTGAFKGHPIDKTVWEDGGTGVLHITNQRVCFSGPQRAVSIPYKKMISVGGFEGGFIVQTSNENKPGIFVVRHPELTTQLLNLGSHPPEEAPSNKRPPKALPNA